MTKPRPTGSVDQPLIFQPPRVPLVDGNGLITREWYRYFELSYARIGGADASTPQQIIEEIGVNTSYDSGLESLKAESYSQADIQALMSRLDAMRDQVTELGKAIQDLQVSLKP